MRELFGPDTAVRFRPHYFPFTEPSFEIDVKSKALQEAASNGSKCAAAGWCIRRVFEEINRARGDDAYDPEKWTGFAFGLGMDRLAMIFSAFPTSGFSRRTICDFLSNSHERVASHNACHPERSEGSRIRFSVLAGSLASLGMTGEKK